MQPPRGPTFVSVPVDDWDRHCAAPAPRELCAAIARRPGAAGARGRRPRCRAPSADRGRRIGSTRRRLGRDHCARRAPSGAGVGEPAIGAQQFSGTAPAVCRFPAAGSRRHRRSGCRAPISSWCLVRRYSPITSRAMGRTFPPARRLVQLTDDPAAAAWAPVGLSIITNLKLGIAALLQHPPPQPPRPPPPEPARAEQTIPRSADGSLPDAADRGAAPGGQHHRRGGAEQPPGDAGSSADARSPTASTPAPAAAWVMACRPRSASRSAYPSAR